ncbi:unnamed protein product [Lactuca saligna]|uniref:DDE Tnp4 domain-containing protein n=1 Tax=Lactuca saligna TaxID=75948 RepID=A0AA35Y3R1_LACSI|nr:unnamed protein product [Lactuca saligna]
MYRHSKSTTSRCFHRVLRSVIALESLYIQKPQGDVVSKEIQEKRRSFPYFKNCVEAIDGIHFCVKFTYLLTGWEGTASDSRILKNAFNRDDKLVIPNGCYYLVDAGLPHSTVLRAPYRGVRFGWNANTQLIEVDEQVWDNLINVSVHLRWPTLNKYWYFARDRASGENVETVKERNARFNKTTDIKIESISEVDDLLASNDVTPENHHIDDDDEDDIQVVCPMPEQNSSAKKCKPKKRKFIDEEKKEVEPQPQPKLERIEAKIMNVVGDVANVMMEGNKIFESAYHHELTCDEIYQELQPMGLKPNEIPGVLMYLGRN